MLAWSLFGGEVKGSTREREEGLGGAASSMGIRGIEWWWWCERQVGWRRLAGLGWQGGARRGKCRANGKDVRLVRSRVYKKWGTYRSLR